VYDDLYLEHRTTPGFPEHPRRVGAIVTRLRASGVMRHLLRVNPAPGPVEWITRIHSPAYVQRVRTAAESLGEGFAELDSPEVSISAKSYDVAVGAVAGVLGMVDDVMAGRVRNGFCAVRPPGHHALADRAMGFCIFNNVAIAARYLLEKHGLSRVLIVDWDVHHGNGTQAAFERDARVMYFSTHRSPWYPGTGGEDERGLGNILNVPLPTGSGDEAMRKAFEERLKPAARTFKPEFVLISAGFDAHRDDVLGGMNVTTGGYAKLTEIVKAIADVSCAGRLVSVLEGGYNLNALSRSVEAHVRVLMGD